MNLSLVRILAIACFSARALSAGVHQDLELGAIADKLDRTTTTVGKQALHDALYAEPATDSAVLTNHQESIRYVLANEQFAQELHAQLTEYAQSEELFAESLKKTDALGTSALQGLYYQTGPVNHALRGKLDTLFKKFDASPTALAAGIFLDFGAVATSAITHYGMAAVARLAHKKVSCCSAHGHSHSHGHRHKDHKNSMLSPVINALEFAHSWEILTATINLWNWKNKLVLLKALQASLMPVARQLVHLKALHALIVKHPTFTEKLAHFADLDRVCTKQCSEKLQHLLHILEAKTFTGNPSMFSHMGNVLAAHKLLQEVGHELQPAFTAIGEIDHYLGLAKLMQEHAHTPTEFCFPEYHTAATPHIAIKNAWHPLIPTENVVLNDIALGKGHARGILVTAENESGKTVIVVKTTPLCAWLAQTLGIAPAQACALTPFKYFETSIVHQDNVSKGHSLYRAARNRADSIEETIASCAPGEFVFVAHDEPFQCTHEAKGLSEATDHLNNLGEQAVCVVSSHYAGLAKRLNGQNFTNYTIKNYKLLDTQHQKIRA